MNQQLDQNAIKPKISHCISQEREKLQTKVTSQEKAPLPTMPWRRPEVSSYLQKGLEQMQIKLKSLGYHFNANLIEN